jgi:hypothetical protein
MSGLFLVRKGYAMMTQVTEGADAPAPSRRKKPQNQWNDARRAAFIEELYETCCVRDALKKTGMSMSGLYKHREKNAKFRADWDSALDAAYTMLETEMLDRARNGHTQEVVIKDGTIIKIKTVSNRLGLALLRMHLDRVAKIRAAREEQPFTEDAHAVRAEILARLERMKVHRGMAKPHAQREDG